MKAYTRSFIGDREIDPSLPPIDYTPSRKKAATAYRHRARR
ncbi:hypothetical protein [Streptomyces sp. P17]|nr:hypothetical protein [Streptomyces sp. P17]MDT9700276.1 hypothetical protein [Streptomyces sp. P17]